MDSSALSSPPRRGTPDRVLATPYALPLGFAAFVVAVATVTRLVLLALHHGVATDGLAGVLRALGAGFAFDLLAAGWAVAPWMLWLALVPARRQSGRAHRLLTRLLVALAVGGVGFVAAAEVFFFLEFDGRFNFVAVDYLLFPTEVLTNIWESYPVVPVVGGLAIAALAVFLLLRRPVERAFAAPPRFAARAAVTAGFAAILTVLTAALPAAPHVADDRALNEIAANGWCSFAAALAGTDAPYVGLYATRPQPVVFERLRPLLTDAETVPGSFVPASTERRERALAPPSRRNVVVVLEESFGAEYLATLHPEAKEHHAPSFDALTASGTLLTHAYSTGNRTIRALEATTNGLPPLPGIATVRRSASKDLFTLPAVLRQQGYATRFVYGGRALFDGMGAYLRANGVERVIDQGDMPDGAFSTAWGVADETIFDRALGEMDGLAGSGKPFYTLVLTVSNHRPYTYPKGRIAPDPDKRWRVNAVEYADWALGRFMRQAATRPWYRDTIFVLMGDHGPRVYGAAEIPLPSYEVPILFVAPGLVPAGARLDTLASSLDVPPTVLGLLGLEYQSKFFGHDLFHVDPAAGRALMTHNNEIALLRGDLMAVLGLHESTALYRRSGHDAPFEPATATDATGRQLIEDAIAYYDGADTLYRNGGYRLAAGTPAVPPPVAVAATVPARPAG